MIPTYHTIIFLITLSTLTLASTPCPRGSYLSQTGCILCPVGTYSATINTSTCKPCPPGTSYPYTGGQTSDVCRPCVPSTYTSTSGSKQCLKCPSGTNSTTSAAACITCPVGSYITLTGCEACSPGQYQDLPNQSSCKECPSTGQFVSAAGSTSPDACISCDVNETSEGATCTPCFPGTYRPFLQDTSCRQCPLGSSAPQDGSAGCGLCPPGAYGKLIFQYSSFNPACEPCPNGFITYAPGQTFCRKIGFPCPEGYMETVAGDCLRCPVDHYYSKQQGKCLLCPHGMGSAGGLVLECSSCQAVTNAKIRESECVRGFPAEAVETDGFGNCKPGSYRNKDAFGVCSACMPGSFSNKKNADSCTPCPPGSVQPDPMQIECFACPFGTVADEALSCVRPETRCGVNATREMFIETMDICQESQCERSVIDKGVVNTRLPKDCNTCDLNSIKVGELGCEACPIDKISTNGVTCVQCLDAKVRADEFEGNCVCKGRFSENIGVMNGKCVECPNGSFGKYNPQSDENFCERCPPGTFRKKKTNKEIYDCSVTDCNEPTCVQCPSGSYSDEEGALKCKVCPEGTFTYGVGETRCLTGDSAADPIDDA